jgi:hypothetical protein
MRLCQSDRPLPRLLLQLIAVATGPICRRQRCGWRVMSYFFGTRHRFGAKVWGMSSEYVLRLLHCFPNMQGVIAIIEDLRSHVA